MKKKRVLATIASTIIVINSVSVYNTVVYADCEYLVDNGNVTIIRYPNNGDRNVTIPEEVDGKPVTKIASNAFENLPIQEVHIPNTVECIDSNAFLNCSSLSRVVFDNIETSNLTTLGENVFYGCPITTFEFPPSVQMLSTSLFGNTTTNSLNLSFLNEHCNIATDKLISAETPTYKSCTFTSVGASEVQEYALTHNIKFVPIVCSCELLSAIDNGIRIIYTYSNYTDHIEITDIQRSNEKDYTWYGTLFIPNQLENKPVTSISIKNSQLRFNIVEIPENITQIRHIVGDSNYNIKKVVIRNPLCEFVENIGINSSHNVELMGYKNSTAETYSTVYGNNFSYIQNDDTSTNTVTTQFITEPTTTTLATTDIELLNSRIKELEETNKILQETLNSYGNRAYGDMNNDGFVDGRDASLLLTYYAKTSVGYKGTLDDFIQEQNNEKGLIDTFFGNNNTN